MLPADVADDQEQDDREDHRALLQERIGLDLGHEGPFLGVFLELQELPGHPGHQEEQQSDGQLAEVPDQDEVRDDVDPGDDEHEVGRSLVAEQLRVGDVVRLVLRGADLPGDLPDEGREVQGEDGEEVREGHPFDAVHHDDIGQGVEVHDDLHGVVGEERHRQARLDLVLLEEPDRHQGAVGVEEHAEPAVRHEDEVQDEGDSDERDAEPLQFLPGDAARRERAVREQDLVGLLVLEVIGDAQPPQEAEQREGADCLPETQYRTDGVPGDALVQDDDEVQLEPHDGADRQPREVRVTVLIVFV